jgi:hypothetical protein
MKTTESNLNSGKLRVKSLLVTEQRPVPCGAGACMDDYKPCPRFSRLPAPSFASATSISALPRCCESSTKRRAGGIPPRRGFAPTGVQNNATL